MISVTTKGSFGASEKFLKHLKKRDIFKSLERFGERGVAALANATPTDSGETANSWYFEVTQRRGYYVISWHNHNLTGSIPVAVLLQYGHATRNGGWVEGQDFINPAIRPVFDQIATEAWKVVTK